MDNVASPELVVPQPGLIKTIGILNILIGGLLLAVGLACLGLTASVVVGDTPLGLEPETTRVFFDEMRRQRIEDLRSREQAAATEAERDRIAIERKKVEAKHPRVEKEIDFPKVNADLAWLSRYLRLDMLSGPVLNLLLVVAGVGLVLRKNWARVLGLWTAGFKLVRVVALGALLIGVVVPRVGSSIEALMSTEMGREVINQAFEQQARQKEGGLPSGPSPDARDVVQMVRGLGIISACFFLCLGSIYPLVVLLLLARPGARAACVAVGLAEAGKSEPS